MSKYYSEKLSGKRLQRCYEIAPQRVRQYLDAETDFVLRRITPGDIVLELGCGYGRVMACLGQKARRVVGIDTSLPSLSHGRTFLSGMQNCLLIPMDAAQLAFVDDAFDVVVCIQNGISAFHVDQKSLLRESIRVTKRGGTILLSSYSEKFWEHRLEWFLRQSQEGLLGEIDFSKTRDGSIVCKDGFVSSTVGRDRFLALASGLGVTTTIEEVDESSVFCEMTRTMSGSTERS
jgi:2-polyprenyl-6-hydroxyphenyl methylase/3-demethylubiquinone-9 3-methyltransferase